MSVVVVGALRREQRRQVHQQSRGKQIIQDDRSTCNRQVDSIPGPCSVNTTVRDGNIVPEDGGSSKDEGVPPRVHADDLWGEASPTHPHHDNIQANQPKGAMHPRDCRARMDVERLPRQLMLSWMTAPRRRGGQHLTWARRLTKNLKQADTKALEALETDGRGHSKAWVRYAEERAMWREHVVECVRGLQGAQHSNARR